MRNWSGVWRTLNVCRLTLSRGHVDDDDVDDDVHDDVHDGGAPSLPPRLLVVSVSSLPALASYSC